MNYIYADFIACLNNAKKQHFKYIYIKNTKLILETIKIMYDLNLISNFNVIDNKLIIVYLKYINGRSNFKNLTLVSLPSRRINYNAIKFLKYKGHSNSIYIISTIEGLKIDSDCRLLNLYGEILLKIDV